MANVQYSLSLAQTHPLLNDSREEGDADITFPFYWTLLRNHYTRDQTGFSRRDIAVYREHTILSKRDTEPYSEHIVQEI